MGSLNSALKNYKKICTDKQEMPSTQETIMSTELSSSEKHTTINLKREFHNEETSTYWLPKDDEEQKRLTGQHFAYKELLEGNMLASVRESLNFEKGVSVLDIGCGSGVWSMDMAHDYPNCTYDGCDIVDVTNKKLKLDRFTFRQGNVLHGLPYPDNTFDFVYMRLLVYAFRKEEWPTAIKEAIRVVKPGGMLQFVEAGLMLPEDNSSAFYKYVSANFSICSSKGQDPRICEKLEALVSANKEVKVKQYERRRCNTSNPMKKNYSSKLSIIYDLIVL
ncbi:unnamed protein product [Rhizopus stolonifer]